MCFFPTGQWCPYCHKHPLLLVGSANYLYYFPFTLFSNPTPPSLPPSQSMHRRKKSRRESSKLCSPCPLQWYDPSNFFFFPEQKKTSLHSVSLSLVISTLLFWGETASRVSPSLLINYLAGHTVKENLH